MSQAPPVIVVTGAAQGIGRAIAGALLDDGWAVLALDRADEALAATVAALGARGPVARLAGDVGDPATWQAAREAAAALGRPAGLVNNAGFGIWQPPERLTLADWEQVLTTNLTGAFLGVQALAPDLRAAGGAVVNIASTRAHQSEPNSEAYAASKGGLVALTHALAASYSGVLRVNAISPGWIDTAGADPAAGAWDPAIGPEDHTRHFAGRVGIPADVGAAAAFLLDGRRSGFMTGAELVLDGGMTRRMTYGD